MNLCVLCALCGGFSGDLQGSDGPGGRRHGPRPSLGPHADHSSCPKAMSASRSKHEVARFRRDMNRPVDHLHIGRCSVERL